MKAIVGTLLVAVVFLATGVWIGLGLHERAPVAPAPEANPPAPLRADEIEPLRAELAALQRVNRELRATVARLEAAAGPEPVERPLAVQEPSPDFELFRAALVGGDWSPPALTSEDIERILEAEGRAPRFLVVAAQLIEDPELAEGYMEEALDKAPDSPVILARAAAWFASRDEPSERIDEVLDHLREVDPTNSFGSYLAVARLFEAGEPQRALEILSEAGTRSQFNPYISSTVENLEEFYLESGSEPIEARLASTFEMRVDYLMPLRGLSNSLTAHLDTLRGPDRDTRALELLMRGNRLGEQLSLGGRTFVDELVGMAVQAQFLEREREIRERQGDQSRVDWIDEHLENNRLHREEARQLVGRMPEIIAQMTEQDMLSYLTSVAKDGELIALREYLRRHGEK